MSWVHVFESACGTAAALVLWTGGRKIAAAIAFRAIAAALERRRQRDRLIGLHGGARR